MSSFDRRRAGALVLCALGAALALPGCVARPLYASPDFLGEGASDAPRLAELRGRIAVTDAPDRTTQIVRNELLLGLDQGTPVTQPLYQVQLGVTGSETGIKVESGGIVRSAIYRMSGIAKVVRLSDKTVVGTIKQTSIVPFDRTSQLFESERALLDARQQAGEDLAMKLQLGIVRALQDVGAPTAGARTTLPPAGVTGGAVVGTRTAVTVPTAGRL